MKGIILAAGRGSRMGSLTDKLPKCRTVFNKKELIQWQFEALRNAGLNDLAIVRGYLADTFKFDVTYFENTRWSETNMVMSLIAADEWLRNDTCVASYSDIVYSPDAVKRLINFSGDVVMTYDPNWNELWSLRFEDPLLDAETFKLVDDQVVEIGNRAKSINDIEGQYMGLVKYTPRGWQQVSNYMKQFNQDELDGMDMTQLLQGLISSDIKVSAVAIDDDWFEVDTESDLLVYETDFDFNGY
jgi:L-glutamine-phosphate cytidylyltransferase